MTNFAVICKRIRSNRKYFITKDKKKCTEHFGPPEFNLDTSDETPIYNCTYSAVTEKFAMNRVNTLPTPNTFHFTKSSSCRVQSSALVIFKKANLLLPN